MGNASSIGGLIAFYFQRVVEMADMISLAEGLETPEREWVPKR